MSDTKTLIKYVRDRLNDGPNITFGKPTVLDLVETLESAEAHVHELEGSLSSSISKQSEMADCIEQVVKANLALADKAQKTEAEVARLQQRANELLSEELTDYAVRERIQLRGNMHEVLQQNERLTKMVDWLAGRCGALCNDGDMENIGLEATDWKESASRARRWRSAMSMICSSIARWASSWAGGWAMSRSTRPKCGRIRPNWSSCGTAG